MYFETKLVAMNAFELRYFLLFSLLCVVFFLLLRSFNFVYPSYNVLLVKRQLSLVKKLRSDLNASQDRLHHHHHVLRILQLLNLGSRTFVF